jgi:hypothetical protein
MTMTSSIEKFSISKFEYLCYRREYEAAYREFLKLLALTDQNYGVMKGVDSWLQSAEARNISDEHLLTRAAAAISSLVTDANFRFSESGLKRLQIHQRWLGGMFACTPFRNADHVLRALGVSEDARNGVELRGDTLPKFQLFYTPESEVNLNLDALWKHDKVATASLATTLLSGRFLGTPAAHGKRERILNWLPERLDQIESIDQLPMGILHSMYMHCSYADLPGKHDIKKPINTLIRRKLASLGLHDVERKATATVDGKPVLLVVLEWFSKNHSIFRTHSQTMVAMRDKFHLVGMGFDGRVDDAGKAVFHEFIPITGRTLWDQARHVREVSEERQAQMMYMPSVGMFPITMVMACLRVAPLQMMALGHPATTHGHAVDYVVVEEDYVGDEACFSEKLLKLPSDGMPYRPSAVLQELKLPARNENRTGPVKIAIAATSIKLNPKFFQTLLAISKEAPVPVQFHFLVGQATGVVFPQVRNHVRRLFGDKAVVHMQQGYADYMKHIHDCDLFLNPFPFGNTNGIVDTVWAGLVGVCKTGREVHEHIDEGMFQRLGFPDWMVANTIEEYKAAALRLIGNPQERQELARTLSGPQAVEKMIFTGRPEILGQRMQALWQEQVEAGASTREVKPKARSKKKQTLAVEAA